MKNNDGRDNELDQLLKTLKASAPDTLQMQRWQSAVRMINLKNEKVHTLPRIKWAFQLVAAMFVGIMIGAVAFKNDRISDQQPLLVAQISLDDATFERSHDNLD